MMKRKPPKNALKAAYEAPIPVTSNKLEKRKARAEQAASERNRIMQLMLEMQKEIAELKHRDVQSPSKHGPGQKSLNLDATGRSSNFAYKRIEEEVEEVLDYSTDRKRSPQAENRDHRGRSAERRDHQSVRALDSREKEERHSSWNSRGRESESPRSNGGRLDKARVRGISVDAKVLRDSQRGEIPQVALTAPLPEQYFASDVDRTTISSPATAVRRIPKISRSVKSAGRRAHSLQRKRPDSGEVAINRSSKEKESPSAMPGKDSADVAPVQWANALAGLDWSVSRAPQRKANNTRLQGMDARLSQALGAQGQTEERVAAHRAELIKREQDMRSVEELASLQASVRSLTQQLARSTEEVHELESALSSEQAIRNRYEQRAAELDSKLEETEQALSNAQIALKQTIASNQAMTAYREQQDNQLQRMSHDVESRDEKTLDLQAKLAEADGVIQSLNRARDEMVDTMQEQLDTSQTALFKEKAELMQLRARMNVIESENAALARKLEQADAGYRMSLDAKVSQHQSEIRRLEDRMGVYSEKAKGLLSAEAQIALMETEAIEQRNACSLLQTELGHSRAARAEQDQRYSQLEIKLQAAIEQRYNMDLELRKKHQDYLVLKGENEHLIKESVTAREAHYELIRQKAAHEATTQDSMQTWRRVWEDETSALRTRADQADFLREELEKQKLEYMDLKRMYIEQGKHLAQWPLKMDGLHSKLKGKTAHCSALEIQEVQLRELLKVANTRIAELFGHLRDLQEAVRMGGNSGVAVLRNMVPVTKAPLLPIPDRVVPPAPSEIGAESPTSVYAAHVQLQSEVAAFDNNIELMSKSMTKSVSLLHHIDMAESAHSLYHNNRAEPASPLKDEGMALEPLTPSATIPFLTSPVSEPFRQTASPVANPAPVLAATPAPARSGSSNLHQANMTGSTPVTSPENGGGSRRKRRGKAEKPSNEAAVPDPEDRERRTAVIVTSSDANLSTVISNTDSMDKLNAADAKAAAAMEALQNAEVAAKAAEVAKADEAAKAAEAAKADEAAKAAEAAPVSPDAIKKEKAPRARRARQAKAKSGDGIDDEEGGEAVSPKRPDSERPSETSPMAARAVSTE